MLQQSRAHLKAAARGLPRLEDVLALPRQRFDACDKRLGRALLANARAHHTRYARISGAAASGADHAAALRCAANVPGRLQARAAQALRNGLVARRRQLEGYDKLLGTLSYQSVLQRGFALVRDSDGRMLRRPRPSQAGDRLDIEFHDGRVEAEALSGGAGGTGKAALPCPHRKLRPACAARAVAAAAIKAPSFSRHLVCRPRWCLTRLPRLAMWSADIDTETRMNRIDKFFGLRGEAKVKFLDGEFQVLSPGDFVRCAVTGRADHAARSALLERRAAGGVRIAGRSPCSAICRCATS